MKPVQPVAPSSRRARSLRRAAAGLLVLFAGMLLGGFTRSPLLQVLSVTLGFLGLVWCVHRALRLWRLDKIVFEDSPMEALEKGRSRPPVRNRRAWEERTGTFRLLCLLFAAVSALVMSAGPGGIG